MLLAQSEHLSDCYRTMLTCGQVSTRTSQSTSDILWSLAGILLILLAFAIAAVIIRRILNLKANEPPSQGFSLSDIRRLHRDGRLTEAEYETARAVILSAAGYHQPKSEHNNNEQVTSEHDTRNPADLDGENGEKDNLGNDSDKNNDDC